MQNACAPQKRGRALTGLLENAVMSKVRTSMVLAECAGAAAGGMVCGKVRVEAANSNAIEAHRWHSELAEKASAGTHRGHVRHPENRQQSNTLRLRAKCARRLVVL